MLHIWVLRLPSRNAVETENEELQIMPAAKTLLIALAASVTVYARRLSEITF